MTTHQLFVENMKCSSCVAQIEQALPGIAGVTGVQITPGQEKVCVSAIAVEREILVYKLAALGYPEKGYNNLVSKARSLIYCALKG